MPTGYTCIIDDHADVTFEQYVWRCARAFGALVLMRDDGMDAPIPEKFEASDYHVKALERDTAKLIELEGMKLAQAKVLAAADHEAALRRWEETVVKESAIDARYQAIREKVEAWHPPSSEHVGLKEFMLEQLKTGRPRTSADDPEPTPKTAREWLDGQIKNVRWSVEYHTKELRKERERTDERNRWIAGLRSSVPYVKQPDRS
jgi:hypothetical protein